VSLLRRLFGEFIRKYGEMRGTSRTSGWWSAYPSVWIQQRLNLGAWLLTVRASSFAKCGVRTISGARVSKSGNGPRPPLFLQWTLSSPDSGLILLYSIHVMAMTMDRITSDHIPCIWVIVSSYAFQKRRKYFTEFETLHNFEAPTTYTT
jgi:hypothetical protein